MHSAYIVYPNELAYTYTLKCIASLMGFAMHIWMHNFRPHPRRRRNTLYILCATLRAQSGSVGITRTRSFRWATGARGPEELCVPPTPMYIVRAGLAFLLDEFAHTAHIVIICASCEGNHNRRRTIHSRTCSV